jgi:hypothetical protein
MVYSELLTLDPDPGLLENQQQAMRLRYPPLLHVSRKIREEATEIFTSRNTWVALHINSPYGNWIGLTHPDLFLSQAQIATPEDDELRRRFLHSNSIVVQIGHACGVRHGHPLTPPGDYVSIITLFAYNRQGFGLFCLRLWECVEQYRNITMVLSTPPALNNTQVLRNIISDLRRIRGAQRAACYGLPNHHESLQLAQHLGTNITSWRGVFRLLRTLSDSAEGAANAGRLEDTIHKCRILYETARYCTYSVRSVLPDARTYRNAYRRVFAESAFKKSLAILTFASACRAQSNQRFANLSPHLIGSALEAAHTALMEFPGMSQAFRRRGHELRGNAALCQARRRRLDGSPAAEIQADEEKAALDFYFARLLVDRVAEPGQLDVDRSLTQVESMLGWTRADTVAHAQVSMVTEPATGLAVPIDGRMLSGWGWSVASLEAELPNLRRFPAPEDVAYLI